MKAIMVMFDSLNRNYLPTYGCDWVKAPNFERLRSHSVMFKNSYVGSLPCMPARRELHTGRYNFLHRSWSPLEPFDDSMPEILKNHNIYTHLASDHQHYWEDGGATYHPRYNSWEAIRGQEGDPWKADLSPDIASKTFLNHEPIPVGLRGNLTRQDVINRRHMPKEKDHCIARTFEAGMEFLETNYSYDNWFLQIESFDPHEPFFSCEAYENLYPKTDVGREIDWPGYEPCVESDKIVEHVRHKYAALVSMCDHYLGRVLDFMDEHDLWKDTMLIVNTDHGYLLGEHSWWAKSTMPIYNQIANTPLFIWDPRCQKKGETRQSLVQTIDLAPTLLDYFNVPIPKDMQGVPLKDTIENDTPVRQYALFGYHGTSTNVTDGHYVYMRNSLSDTNVTSADYTLMPTHMRCRYSANELQKAELVAPFSFTKGCPVLKVPMSPDNSYGSYARFGNRLYDVIADPGQENPLNNPKEELRLIHAMETLMHQNDAPEEEFTRLGLSPTESMTMETLLKQKEELKSRKRDVPFENVSWSDQTIEQYHALSLSVHEEHLAQKLQSYMQEHHQTTVTEEVLTSFVRDTMKGVYCQMIINHIICAGRTD